MNDSVFRALSDPTRRKILELLAKGDRSAGEIAEKFPVAFASVSHHLAVLRSAGLVATERQGQSIVYRLDTTVYQELMRSLLKMFGKDPHA
jgi:ArsR family transcriptional regulator, arsenate/arsenite/antimonite-responsive transcriptional repressor